ncbi:hypothetical protein M0L20_25545 [Spirosoma sp. RP8]|uniref:Lipoprotein n=1 Tax=Spirosoma liriopis TaxID=2937440 RepID=A0ABT0HUS5_9BACT|nr:hypothetical protein [Spirosoma liriopis]MCK8495260.1 hypothetical protein [Spirosoma liriopis]
MEQVNRNKQALLYGGIMLLSFFISSCFQEPTCSKIPQIKFKGFSRYALQAGSGVGQSKRDSLQITIGFTDGDGDLGDVLPIDSLEIARYRQAGGWGNYKIIALQLKNGQYQPIPTGENTTLFFPRLSGKGRTGPIEGDLELEQLYPYGNRFTTIPTKYQIQIRDRALNVSNEIETGTIHLPYFY